MDPYVDWIIAELLKNVSHVSGIWYKFSTYEQMVFVFNWENKNAQCKLNINNEGPIIILLTLFLYSSWMLTTNLNFK